MNSQEKEWIIDNYWKVYQGEIKCFSPYFFQKEHRKKRITVIFRYFIEEIKGYKPEEAYQKVTYEDLKQYKLVPLLRYIPKPDEIDKKDLIYLFAYIYPHLYSFPTQKELTISLYKKVLSGERKNFPKGYFSKGLLGEERAKYCLEYLVYEILQLKTVEEIEKVLNVDILRQYKLKIVLNVLYISLCDLIESVFKKNI